MKLLLPFLIIVLTCTTFTCLSQDSSQIKVLAIPSRYFEKVAKESSVLTKRIDRKSKKLLQRLERQERKLSGILASIDSVNGKVFLAESEKKYSEILGCLNQKASAISGKLSGEYLPYFDSLKGSLSFLKNKGNLLSSLKSEKLDNALGQVKEFEGKLQQADIIKEFIRERKAQIQDMLSRYPNLPVSITKLTGKYSQQIFYYSATIRDYRETFRDPDKVQRIALTILNKMPAFQAFMKEHSQLAGLFNLPNDYGSPAGLIGLQTRDQVQQIITSQMGGGTAANAGQIFGQQIQAAQSQLAQFKDKLTALGGGSGDIEMPEFKPKSQRTKTFFQRLEYGTNIQSTRASSIFPSTTDIGLSIGYRLDGQNIIGVGGAYKIGWGRDIRHVAFSSQGMSLRSFIDIKLKKSFFVSGGFEYNYQKPFKEVRQLYNIDAWQKSGLLGISKIISVKSKVFKKTKIQLLWDFLSYQQVPRTQPFKFRVGYNF